MCASATTIRPSISARTRRWKSRVLRCNERCNERSSELVEVNRRISVAVRVDDIVIGGGAPVVVQSMTNTDTADAAGTAAQVADLARAGSELVRITVNNDDAAAAVPEIVARLSDMGVNVPVIGDFHYNGHLLLTRHPDCARALAKYR